MGWSDVPRAWAPRPYETTLIGLNAWEERDARGRAIRKVSWNEVALRVGLDGIFFRGFPSSRQLRATKKNELRNSRLFSPMQGRADPEVAQVIGALLPTDDGATLGMYLGPPGSKSMPGTVVVELRAHMHYWFARVEAREALDAWCDRGTVAAWTAFNGRQDAGLMPSDSLAFLWPDDESWFLWVDPDCEFTALSCSREQADRIVAAAPDLEWWQGDQGGPYADHHIPYRRS